MDSPQLLFLQDQDGLPYGVCSLCEYVFHLALIGDDNENHTELQSKFRAHVNTAHNGEGNHQPSLSLR